MIAFSESRLIFNTSFGELTEAIVRCKSFLNEVFGKILTRVLKVNIEVVVSFLINDLFYILHNKDRFVSTGIV